MVIFFNRNLQFDKQKALALSKGCFRAGTWLSFESKQEILWWIDDIDSASKPIGYSPPHLVMECDASKIGWGATTKSHSANGTWNSIEREFHINYLDL